MPSYCKQTLILTAPILVSHSSFNLVKLAFLPHQALTLLLSLTHKARISTRVIYSFLNYPIFSCLIPPSEIILLLKIFGDFQITERKH